MDKSEKLEIRKHPDPVLREKSSMVKQINRSVRDLLDRMAVAMREVKGVGLAAPQVGVSRRIIILEKGDGVIELINPEIINRQGEATAYEGCLSIPGLVGKVKRAEKVRATGLDREGRRVWVDGEGLLGRAIQHEIDHLDGILFVDKAESIMEVPPETELDIVFFGTPEFAVPILERLLQNRCRVMAVVTQPDRPRGRGQAVHPSPVKKKAVAEGVTVWQPEKAGDPGFLEQVRASRPDLIVTAAYGQILPRELLEIPTRGCVNVHASLLPRYRGAAPIQWAIINGEKETGVTTFFMDEGMDTGDLILQRSMPITRDDSFGSLHDKLSHLGAEVLLETLRLIGKGEAPRVPQDHSKATYAPRITDQMAKISWDEEGDRLVNLFRGLDPFPGAYTFWRNRRLKIFRGSLLSVDEVGRPPGEILNTVKDRGFVVATGRGEVLVEELQKENSRRMGGGEFLQGHEIVPGEKLM